VLEVKSVDMCSLNQTVKPGLLDPWRWNRLVCWNVSNYSSMLRNIPQEPRSHLHHGRSLISCKLLL